MLTIEGPTPKQLLRIQDNKLLILIGATWDDYWTLANEDLKIDFIEDRIYIHSPANVDHEEIFGFMLTLIRNYLSSMKLGRVLGSRFPIESINGKRIEPDLVFLSEKSLNEGELSKTLFKGSPSWIIEIISPGYREHDTITKYNEYRMLDVSEYWMIDPEEKKIEVIKFKGQKEVFKKMFSAGKIRPAIEGFNDFTLDISDLWNLLQQSQVNN